MVSDVPNLPSWEASRICLVCEDEVPEEHFVISHLLTPLTLAVCYECFSWRDTWDAGRTSGRRSSATSARPASEAREAGIFR